MATNFPVSKDDGTSLPYPAAGNYTNSPSNAGIQDNQNDAIIAIETKLGIGSSTPSANKFLTGTGVGSSGWANTVPSGTVVGTSDIQTLTNKTLTSPTINSPTINNATISADAITGYTVATTGTIYGIGVATSSITSGLTNLTATGSITAGNNLVVSAGTITAPTGSLSSRALSNPYKFSAYLNAATQAVGIADTPIAFDTELFDTNNNFDTTTNKGRYTAPVDGFYFFTARARAVPGVGGYLVLYVLKNGTRVNAGNISRASSNSIAPVVSAMLQLTAGDYVEISAVMDAANNITGGNVYDTAIQGFFVSAI